MKKAIIRIILIIILLFIVGCGRTTENKVNEFSTEISGYNYNPGSIKVNFGDTVKINIKNNDQVTHGVSLPVFGVQEFVRPGEIKIIQFVADRRGNPETFCSIEHGEKLLIEVV